MHGISKHLDHLLFTVHTVFKYRFSDECYVLTFPLYASHGRRMLHLWMCIDRRLQLTFYLFSLVFISKASMRFLKILTFVAMSILVLLF